MGMRAEGNLFLTHVMNTNGLVQRYCKQLLSILETKVVQRASGRLFSGPLLRGVL